MAIDEKENGKFAIILQAEIGNIHCLVIDILAFNKFTCSETLPWFV